MHKFVEMQSEYQELTDLQYRQAMKSNTTECCMAYLLIHGRDQAKYVAHTKVFVSHYSLGSNQYPRSIITATRQGLCLDFHKLLHQDDAI